MRIIKFKWTQRNIERIHKLLKITSNFDGTFKGKYSGYKLTNKSYMFLHIHQ